MKIPESIRDLGRESFRMWCANAGQCDARCVALAVCCLMSDLGRTSRSTLAGRKTREARSWDATAACSALGNAERVSSDTNEISAEYGSPKSGVNVSHLLAGHHLNANHALRAGAVNARSRVTKAARSALCAEALTATSTAPRSST